MDKSVDIHTIFFTPPSDVDNSRVMKSYPHTYPHLFCHLSTLFASLIHTYCSLRLFWVYMARALQGPTVVWRHFVAAGVLTGLSIMSKGPVLVYGLLLPFLISFSLTYRPAVRGKAVGVAMMIAVALATGLWWYVCVRRWARSACGASK